MENKRSITTVLTLSLLACTVLALLVLATPVQTLESWFGAAGEEPRASTEIGTSWDTIDGAPGDTFYLCLHALQTSQKEKANGRNALNGAQNEISSLLEGR